MKFLIINGPNINMLGIREPEIYGAQSYAALTELCRKTCEAEGIEVKLFQSADGVFDGIIINPAAYTHTSVAILDALKAVALPAVEVHISDIASRESFRRVSYAGVACVKTFAGLGFDGYVQAIRVLKGYVLADAERELKRI